MTRIIPIIPDVLSLYADLACLHILQRLLFSLVDNMLLLLLTSRWDLNLSEASRLIWQMTPECINKCDWQPW